MGWRYFDAIGIEATAMRREVVTAASDSEASR